MKQESGWKIKSQEEIASVFEFSQEYKGFLDLAKTEREAIRYIRTHLAGHGFSEGPGTSKVFQTNRGKELIAFVQGATKPG